MGEILFKNPRVEREWGLMVSGERPSLLIPFALTVNLISIEVAGVPAVVTMIYREQYEQDYLLALMGVTTKRKSVHQFWRGLDFRSWIYTPRQRARICFLANEEFEYGGGKKCLAFHPRGTAGHLHGQIPGLTPWRM